MVCWVCDLTGRSGQVTLPAKLFRALDLTPVRLPLRSFRSDASRHRATDVPGATHPPMAGPVWHLDSQASHCPSTTTSHSIHQDERWK